LCFLSGRSEKFSGMTGGQTRLFPTERNFFFPLLLLGFLGMLLYLSALFVAGSIHLSCA
jgi:hypothetical protein